MASSKPANEAHQPLAMCAVCWKNPLKPPFLHNPSAKHQPIPKRKDDLIKAINGNTGSGSLAGYTVKELRHLYSLKIGRKAHESCPLIGLASMHREEMAQLCKNHGVHLGGENTPKLNIPWQFVAIGRNSVRWHVHSMRDRRVLTAPPLAVSQATEIPGVSLGMTRSVPSVEWIEPYVLRLAPLPYKFMCKLNSGCFCKLTEFHAACTKAAGF